MSSIVRLYPPAWRERYGDELVALLAERPPSLVDNLDLMLGALDARLHPQVAGSDPQTGQEIPVTRRLLGAMAAVGGIAWILAIASMYMLPRSVDGYRDAALAAIGLALATALIGSALGELGTREGSQVSRRTGHGIALGSIVLGVTLLMPWPVLVIGFLGFPVLGGLAAVRGFSNARLPGWFVGLYTVAAVVSFLSLFGVGVESDSTLALVALTGVAALVLAWISIAGRSDGASATRLA